MDQGILFRWRSQAAPSLLRHWSLLLKNKLTLSTREEEICDKYCLPTIPTVFSSISMSVDDWSASYGHSSQSRGSNWTGRCGQGIISDRTLSHTEIWRHFVCSEHLDCYQRQWKSWLSKDQFWLEHSNLLVNVLVQVLDSNMSIR